MRAGLARLGAGDDRRRRPRAAALSRRWGEGTPTPLRNQITLDKAILMGYNLSYDYDSYPEKYGYHTS